jgi:hypothetical protein
MKLRDLQSEFLVMVELPHFQDKFPGLKIPMCGLCGNSGIVNTVGVVYDASSTVDCGIISYCICPNGRAMKKKKVKI